MPMIIIMKKYIYIITCLASLLFCHSVFAAECTLSSTSSSPINDYIKNVEKILDAAKSAASGTQCAIAEWWAAHLKVAIPAQSVRGLLNNIQSVWYSLASLLSDIRYYFDSSDTMLLASTQEHQKIALEILQKIVKASVDIGSKCAQGVVTFKEDVALDNSTYKTKNRTLQEVLKDTTEQTTHVLIFFRNLVTNVADREYIDETHFPIAPTWFANNMRTFYSSENIQKCHDEDPKNQKIQEVLKEAFTTGWKYPQAIQIWKDAFALLLYRSGQITGSGETDASKDAQINAIVQAQKWGLGNSRTLINGQIIKEFLSNPKNQTITERIAEASKRVAYETFGSLFIRQTIPDIKNEYSNQSSTSISQFPKSDKNGQRLAAIDKNLYTDYAGRKVPVGENKAQDPRTVVWLVQAIEQLELARPIIEEIAKLVCDIYGRQATNVSRPTCQELFNI